MVTGPAGGTDRGGDVRLLPTAGPDADQPSQDANEAQDGIGQPAPADGQLPATADGEADREATDWAWVEEWRATGEPVPWGPGLALAGFIAALVACAVYVLSDGLADRPLLAIAVNVVVAGGLAPALWLSRKLPVLRWVAGGAVIGVLAAWIAVLIFVM